MVEFIVSNVYARTASLLAIFLLAAFVALTASRWLARYAEVRAGLRDLEGNRAVASLGRLRKQNESAWTRLADQIEKAGLNLSDTKGDALRAKLIAAGFESPAAPRIFTLTKVLMILLLPSIYVFLFVVNEPTPNYLKIYIVGAFAALLGMVLPSLFITAKADRRSEAIRNGFPDSLDLILICVEAGLGLEAALDRVGREMIDSHPLVARLLSTATLQLRAGAPREVAIRAMGEQSCVDEVRSFATLLIQSDRLGTSISQTLRVYASEMREKRQMRAEEKAHRLPVVISIPLVICMLPTMIGVLMLPGMVRVVRELLPALGG
ncbi:MAG: type II secretion system F family protein [Novosphingobium sp.]|jgi:tight adherence protein C|uniref:type II secretion system F family protein n=1 Tax=Novosphingobium sp. TaxID=1874826 RepID=UPI00391ABEEB